MPQGEKRDYVINPQHRKDKGPKPVRVPQDNGGYLVRDSRVQEFSGRGEFFAQEGETEEPTEKVST